MIIKARPKVKVCGMREPENIREAEALGIDLMGFIFWPKSSRFVSERPAYLPTKCKRVGVFVDEHIEEVQRIAGDYALDIIQLHGHESPDYIRQLPLPAQQHLSHQHSACRQKAEGAVRKVKSKK